MAVTRASTDVALLAHDHGHGFIDHGLRKFGLIGLFHQRATFVTEFLSIGSDFLADLLDQKLFTVEQAFKRIARLIELSQLGIDLDAFPLSRP